jgi:septum formation protein
LYLPAKKLKKDPVHCKMAATNTDTSSSSSPLVSPQGSSSLVLSLSHHLGPCHDTTCADIHLILASQSPRRQEILDMMGLQGKFTTTPSPLDETALQRQLTDHAPIHYTRILAEEKAKALAVEMVAAAAAASRTLLMKPTLILGSDTIVDLDGSILEKPIDQAAAKVMLRSLSGRQHSVHTGVAIYLVLPDTEVSTSPTLVDSFTDTAQVCFAELSEHDIDAYIATKEPMDKAGAYGIQGIGGQFVAHVNGDFFTVMGLPMHRTSQLLAKAVSNIIILESK